MAPPTTLLGVQHSSEEEGTIYTKIGEINGHTFTVPPVNRFHSKTAETKFVQLTGGLHPKFEAQRFNQLRDRLQMSEKKEKDSYLKAIAVLYAEQLGNCFLLEKNINYEMMEKCFYPNFLPTYEEAINMLGYKKKLWWRQGMFSMLEDISRLPLDRCNSQKETSMSFQEWYSLFWNYYQPFNTLAYLLMVTAQSTLFTRELIHNVADYLAYRHGLIEDPKAKKAPILFLGARTGKFGALLNQTKKIPVPIIHTHENPNTNPYLLLIPQHKQAEMKPHAIIKKKNQAALEHYEPSIVLFSDMTMNSDPTAQIRKIGSVREYIYFGVPNSYIEGHAWDTWGYFKYRGEEKDYRPPYMREGWAQLSLPHLSRWMLYKLDSDMLMGTSAVTTWMRKPLMPSSSMRWHWRFQRFRPLF